MYWLSKMQKVPIRAKFVLLSKKCNVKVTAWQSHSLTQFWSFENNLQQHGKFYHTLLQFKFHKILHLQKFVIYCNKFNNCSGKAKSTSTFEINIANFISNPSHFLLFSISQVAASTPSHPPPPPPSLYSKSKNLDML